MLDVDFIKSRYYRELLYFILVVVSKGKCKVE